MIRLIVLDCDGVMFDSKRSNVRYYNDALGIFGYPPMTEEEETYSHMATVDDALTHIFRNYPEELQQIKEVIATELTYNDYARYIRMEPDLPDFLARAVPQYKMAISTNRGNTMLPLLERYNLSHYFLKVMTSLTAKRPKPAPDGLQEILDALQCKPEETLFVGDSVLDKMQAAACGVELVAFKNRALHAEYHVDSFMEIFSLPKLSTAS